MSGYMEKRDWGIYNPIVNGGNQAGLWRTLTGTEWGYVLGRRWTPYAIAIVNGVWGVVVLPDGWDEPETLPTEPSTESDNTEPSSEDPNFFGNLVGND